MKCTICKTGQTHPGITTVTLQRDNTVMVIRDFPTDICDDCGEYYLTKRLRAGCMRMLRRARIGMLKLRCSDTPHKHLSCDEQGHGDVSFFVSIARFACGSGV